METQMLACAISRAVPALYPHIFNQSLKSPKDAGSNIAATALSALLGSQHLIGFWSMFVSILNINELCLRTDYGGWNGWRVEWVLGGMGGMGERWNG